MDKIVLPVTSRQIVGKKVRELREKGSIPAVVYGHDVASTAIEIAERDLTKAYSEAGSSKIIGIKIDDNRQKNAIFQDVQQDSLTGRFLHADLFIVRMDEKIRTEVPLRYVGESTAVYQQEGTLVKNMEEVEVEALPADLPEVIEVDISILDDFEKSIHVRDLVVAEGVTIMAEEEELVVKVDPPRSDEELAELDSEVVEELPEGVAEEGEDDAALEDEAEPASGGNTPEKSE